MKGSVQNSRAGSVASLASSPTTRNSANMTVAAERKTPCGGIGGDNSAPGSATPRLQSVRRGVLAPGSKGPSQLGVPTPSSPLSSNGASGPSTPNNRARRMSVGAQQHRRTSSLVAAAVSNARSANGSSSSVPVEPDLPPLDPAGQALCDRLGISPREYLELTEVFRLVDKDGGGTISKDELELLMRTLGIRASKVEMDIMVNEIVNDPSKEEIDLEAFITAMSRKVTTSLPEDQLMAAFRQFDEGGALTPLGRIKTEHLFTILESMGDSSRFMKHDDVEDLLNSVAPQALATGHFDYANFVRMLFSS